MRGLDDKPDGFSGIVRTHHEASSPGPDAVVGLDRAVAFILGQQKFIDWNGVFPLPRAAQTEPDNKVRLRFLSAILQFCSGQML